MSILQRIAAIALALALSFSAAFTAVTHDAAAGVGTPAVGTPSASADTPVVGDEVPIYDVESGDEIASITVESITDPFEDYDTGYEPERGSRYVAVEYTITNEIPNDRLDSPAYYLSLATDDGRLASSAYVGLPEDSDVTELPTDEILGGESTTGTLFYLLGDEVTVGGVYYNNYGYFALLADVSGQSSPTIGDDVTVFNTAGDEYAAVTVTDFEDPFEDYAEFYEPERGTRYVAATVSVENLIPNDGIDLSSYQFFVQTREGYLLSTAFVEPAEDSDVEALEDTRLGGGDSGGGTIFFTVPEDAEITGIIYSPESGIVINVGNPQA